MQKKFIVLAIASLGLASASAFAADATVYGNLDAALVNVSGSGQKGGMLAVTGGLTASRLGVKASEDLDGGLKAVANMEFSIDSETNVGLATATGGARQELVGIAGGFGTVATGYLQTVGYDWSKAYDPLAGSSVSSLQNVTGAIFLLGQKGSAVRAQRALAYISPDISGLTIAVNYSTALSPTGLSPTGDVALASSAATINTTATLVGANYVAGPLAVGLAYASLGGASTDTELGIAVSYDLGAAKLFLSNQSYTAGATPASGATANTSNSATALSAVVPMGGDAVALQYAMNTINSDSAKSATGYSLGYLHPMSKTTTAYAAYSGVTNGSGTAAFGVDNGTIKGIGNGSNSSIIALGINKKF